MRRPCTEGERPQQHICQMLLLVAAFALLAACSTRARIVPGGTGPAPSGAAGSEPMSTPPAPPPTALAPTAHWQAFTSGNQVQAVAFSPDGVLWAATEGGLVHWDLVDDSYVQYTTDDGLVSNQVMGIAFGPDGSLWLATLGGIARFHDGQWHSYTEADGLPADAVRSIAVAPTGEVWAGTTEGAARWDGSGWTSYFPGQAVWALDVAPDGAIWLAVGGLGISRFDPAEGTWLTHSTEQGLPAQGVTTLDVGPAGDIWAYVNWEGVWHLDAASVLAPSPEAGPETGAIWQRVYESGLVCAIESTGTETWIGTCGSTHYSYGDLVSGHEGAWSAVDGWSDLGDPAIRSIAASPDGLLAVGTEAGVSVRQAGRWRTLRAGPTRNRVTSVAVTPDGAAWLAFGDTASDPAGGGLSRFDGTEWQYFLGDANILSLAVGPDGALWAGGGFWVGRFAEGQWQEIAGDDRLDSNVIDIAPVGGGVTWIATQFSVYRFDGQGWQTWPHLVPGAIGAGPDGTLWLSKTALSDTGCGLWYYREETWHELEGRAPCGQQLAVDRSGALWILAPDGAGLERYADGGWQSYPAPGPALGRVLNLTASAQGELWLAREQGLSQLAADGWRSYEFPRQAVIALATAPDGSLWLGTPAGAVHAWPQVSPPAASTGAPIATETAAPSPADPEEAPLGTRTPQPTMPPTPTTVPSAAVATSGPQVTSFEARPAQVNPGDTVTLSWKAEGERARICPSARYVLFTEDDCQPVPPAGSATFEIPLEAAGFQYVDFVLTVSGGDPQATVTAQVSVSLKCERIWFFSDEPQAGICPREPLQSAAAAQPFERGSMIWLEQPGRYYILIDAPLNDDPLRKRLDLIEDPLEITGDTSDQAEPPAGLHAPVSGFGLVWRGDVAQSPGYQQELGWALAPELAYQAILQCDDARPSGGRSWQTCYLRDPDGDVIVLHPLGGWYLLEQQP